MNLPERRKRYNSLVRLRTNHATLTEIGAMFGLSRERVRQILLAGEPKALEHKGGVLFQHGFSKLKGRDRARMMVRIRDNFTCQDCGSTRKPSDVQIANASKSDLKGRIKHFDIHHQDGRCGKKSHGYDSTNDLSGLITLCHRCHYNRPEHRVQSPDFPRRKVIH